MSAAIRAITGYFRALATFIDMKKPASRHLLGAYRLVRALIFLIMLVIVAVLFRGYLETHPQHNPFAPLDLRDPIGPMTGRKLAAIGGDISECRAALHRSEIGFTALDPVGEGACERPDRTQLEDFPLAPATPPVTCPVAAALEMWRLHSLEPAAQEIFGTGLARIEHLGAFSCRRTYGREDGAWSEHATANAIDIAGFVLEDGSRISVLGDWQEGGDKALFLRRVRDDSCRLFATVLSPDYNAAHADHLHLDQSQRWRGLCR